MTDKPMTFDVWWDKWEPDENHLSEYKIAQSAWNARQPEIDAANAERDAATGKALRAAAGRIRNAPVTVNKIFEGLSGTETVLKTAKKTLTQAADIILFLAPLSIMLRHEIELLEAVKKEARSWSNHTATSALRNAWVRRRLGEIDSKHASLVAQLARTERLAVEKAEEKPNG